MRAQKSTRTKAPIDTTLFQKYYTGDGYKTDIGVWMNNTLFPAVITIGTCQIEWRENCKVVLDKQEFNFTPDDLKVMKYKKETKNFSLPQRGWELELGKDGSDGKFWLKINGVKNSDLPAAPRSALHLPNTCRSETLPIYNEALRSEVFVYFVQGKKHFVQAEHSAKS